MSDESARDPRFDIGDQVRVRKAFPPGHCRTPAYCRGKSGRVVSYCGKFRNPEDLAYGKRDSASSVPLYRVRFERSSLWPQDGIADRDCVEIEIYEHWLEPGKRT
jgi:nitrile hydratase